MQAVIRGEFGWVDMRGWNWQRLAEVYNEAVFVREEKTKEIGRELACRRM